jgi:hypothetical protein
LAYWPIWPCESRGRIRPRFDRRRPWPSLAEQFFSSRCKTFPADIGRLLQAGHKSEAWL